jgi:hypothetical protein
VAEVALTIYVPEINRTAFSREISRQQRRSLSTLTSPK